METLELVDVLRYALHSTRLACAEVNQELQRFRDEHAGQAVNQQAQVTSLQASVERLCQGNEALQADLDIQRSNYNLVVGDMVRLCEERQHILGEKQQALEEKQHALEERDAALLERDLNSLMLDQYRDETTEKQRMLGAKEVEIENMAAKLTSVEAELCALRNQCCRHVMREVEARPSTGAAMSAKHRKRRRRNRGDRRGEVSPPN
ncbi:uncharacterized protein PG998_000763 [Apiospora kogelbergensis]|uniref:uncharacterized protein n=1 Tax=Apiospora kogelbergensis TaxID=1337665 RepID=UPI00312CFAE4